MAAAAASPSTSTATAMDPPPPTARSVRHSSPAAAMHPPPSATSQTIKTPLSSTYPNSIHSPLQSTAPKNKLNSSNDVKTPLTPPSAYLDFLRVLSPNPYTPSPLSTGTSTRFSHDNSNYPSPAFPSAILRDDKHLLRPTISSARSTSSGSSFSSISSSASSALSAAAGTTSTSRPRPPQANTSKPLQRPSELAFGRAHPPSADPITTTTVSATDPTSGVRTTEITRPQTARAALQPGTPRLIIPPSPSSTIEPMSPAQHSAPATTANVPHSACPPSSAHAQSAVLKSAGWTPASAVARENLWAKAAGTRSGTPNEGTGARETSPASAGGSSPVTIKHVVTRTVTYRRGTGTGAAAAGQRRVAAGSPLSAVERVGEGEEERKTRRLIGEVPRGKRRRVE